MHNLKFLPVVAICCVAAPLMASSVGSELIDRPANDTASGFAFFYRLPGQLPQGQEVVSWSFYSNSNADPGKWVTPLIVEDLGGDVFGIAAIGTSRQNQGTGIQTWGFDALAGSPVIDRDELYIGWWDGNIATSPNATPNTGVIDFSYAGVSTGGIRWAALVNPQIDGEIGTSGPDDVNQRGRIYSVEYQLVESAPPIPEPLTVMGLGLATAAVGRYARRRRRD